MTILQSVILGIVQGITELLPISSSAHLNLIPWIFNWTNSQAFNEGFHAQELHGQPFQYSDQEKTKIKQKIFSSLPTDHNIKLISRKDIW